MKISSTGFLLFLGLITNDCFCNAQQVDDNEALALAVECNSAKQGEQPLIFVVPEFVGIESTVADAVVEDLAKIGFNVEKKELSRSDINIARQSGDFHFSLTRTWGAPYDPHAFASGWIDGRGGDGVFPAMENFVEPMSREELFDMIRDVLGEEDVIQLQPKWEAIHRYYHQQAVMMPLWGARVPTLMSSRLTGYQPGTELFDYPVHRLEVLSGSTTVTIAPGSRTGLFKTVGRLDAHTYGPNEFFASNWIYEGLLAYGPDGQLLPQLAESWEIQPNDIGGSDYIFQLRQGVLFHDGTAWDCAAAKLNFDHVLAGNLPTVKHGWYGVPLYTEEWFCNGDFEFTLRTNLKYGPYLQELTFIRPIRMMSPAAFQNGTVTDPFLANSCAPEWGTIAGDAFTEDVNCVGITAVYGTGPFAFEERETAIIFGSEEVDNKVIFRANDNYWGGRTAVDRLEVIRYETSQDVKDALLNGELDVVWGSSVLAASDVAEIEDDPNLVETIRVFRSDEVQNEIMLLNSGNPPFDDIVVRTTVIHAIQKAAIVDSVFNGAVKVVENVFPLTAPFCNVELEPRWDYDIERAVSLSCDGDSSAPPQSSPPSSAPSDAPSRAPSSAPSSALSSAPSSESSSVPSRGPSNMPAVVPTGSPIITDVPDEPTSSAATKATASLFSALIVLLVTRI